ncbi:hypothetical protein M413DRAFT_32905 [Hebeloma cylindrosporum]|uniref:DUF6533 domain-containing protein n=1 Tax=Hebeloma cylindrosporum TaxID=76867 RepID=A0A0C2Y1I3_HEBCY|nr:hypothetical protein M413DRAFT_32905 [Hebeloma cylindrosporum h7]
MVAHSLSNIVSQARIVSSVNAASIAILVFDSFLTFDLEVSAIWSRKWTFARVLYVFTRYSGFVEAGISIYALLLLFDAVMFILMAIPAWKAYRFQGGTRLVEVVYRDGVVNYLYLFVLSTINILITLTFPTGLGSVMVL